MSEEGDHKAGYSAANAHLFELHLRAAPLAAMLPDNSIKPSPLPHIVDVSVAGIPFTDTLRVGLFQMPVRMRLLGSLKERAKELKQFTLVAYYAARDPRTPKLVRVLALLVAAYALSPVDLIPDFIPVLGYLDDLILIPLGLALVVRLLPEHVLASAREQAQHAAGRPTSKLAASVIVAVWLLVLFLLGRWVLTLEPS